MAEEADAAEVAGAGSDAAGACSVGAAEPGMAPADAAAPMVIGGPQIPTADGHANGGAAQADSVATQAVLGMPAAEAGDNTADAQEADALAAAGYCIRAVPEQDATAVGKSGRSSGGAAPQPAAVAATTEPNMAAAPLQPTCSEDVPAALLGSIVGGELGKLDPVFLVTVPAQVC